MDENSNKQHYYTIHGGCREGTILEEEAEISEDSTICDTGKI